MSGDWPILIFLSMHFPVNERKCAKFQASQTQPIEICPFKLDFPPKKAPVIFPQNNIFYILETNPSSGGWSYEFRL